MSYFYLWIDKVLSLYSLEFTLYGFTFTFWDVMMFGLLCYAMIAFLRRFF